MILPTDHSGMACLLLVRFSARYFSPHASLIVL